MNPRRLGALVLAAMLASAPASAQFDLTAAVRRIERVYDEALERC